jgi:alpha-ribazole phosphatase
MNVLIVRHGATAANRERRYCGMATDLPLSDEGREQLTGTRSALRLFAKNAPVSAAIRRQLTAPVWVAVSPLLRAVETAGLLFPGVRQCIVPGFAEMDFGLFENKTAQELSAAPTTADLYRRWVDSGCALPCPPSAVSLGESSVRFQERTCTAFRELIAEQLPSPESGAGQLITIVAHGGTQMALFERFFSGDRTGLSYFDWQTPCAGFRFGVFAV